MSLREDKLLHATSKTDSMLRPLLRSSAWSNRLRTIADLKAHHLSARPQLKAG
jgi:hypothetical protein